MTAPPRCRILAFHLSASTTWTQSLTSSTTNVIAYGVRTVNDTSFRIGDYETLKNAALDPYQALRNAYIQNRNSKIAE